MVNVKNKKPVKIKLIFLVIQKILWLISPFTSTTCPFWWSSSSNFSVGTSGWSWLLRFDCFVMQLLQQPFVCVFLVALSMVSIARGKEVFPKRIQNRSDGIIMSQLCCLLNYLTRCFAEFRNALVIVMLRIKKADKLFFLRRCQIYFNRNRFRHSNFFDTK